MSDFLTLISTQLLQGLDWLSVHTTQIAAVFVLVLAMLTTMHILLNKRDPRAAAAWVGLVWLVPAVGMIIYMLLGVNRIQQRAKQLIGGELDSAKGWLPAAEPDHGLAHWQGMSTLSAGLSGWPLAGGNDVEILSPAEAISSFVAAVGQAEQSVYFQTYIFGNDKAGQQMLEAMLRAKKRGVDVRVLIDGFGSWYSVPPIVGRMKRAGIRVERFLYSLAPWKMPYVNLRNHRKLLIVDRKIGFVGGMNVRAGYIKQPATINDFHCRVKGPVVGHFLHSFASDWHFVTDENIDNSYAGPARVGDMLCRGISAGPDADFDKRRLTLLAAVDRADKSIRIVTPYFVPDPALQTALQLAALRGVKVEIFLPQQNNLPLVHWASLHVLRWLVGEDCRIYLTAPPFDHSKLMTVDGVWSMVGSGNWDARSLRLNFEYDMECYSQSLAERLNRLIDGRLLSAVRLTKQDMLNQSLPVRLRNALAHLLAPYL